ARIGGEPTRLLEPGEDAVLDEARRVVEATDVGVERRREHLSERVEGRAGADHPAPEARVDVSSGVGEHVVDEVAVDALVALAGTRQWLVQARPRVGGRGRPARAVGPPAGGGRGGSPA